MTRTVMCRKYKEDWKGWQIPLIQAPKASWYSILFRKKAWTEWTNHQTMLINEKHLSMMDPSTREYLQQEMQKFMDGEDYEKAEGYVPPSK